MKCGMREEGGVGGWSEQKGFSFIVAQTQASSYTPDSEQDSLAVPGEPRSDKKHIHCQAPPWDPLTALFPPG